MASAVQAATVSKGRLWTSYVISALPVLMMGMSGVMKLLKPQPVVEGFGRFGYPESLLVILGVVELTCALLYVIPKTSILGAIFVTGYLGGATATHARVLDLHFVFPFLCGVLAWLGLYLRDGRIRTLIPLKND
jgi:DoxX-like protein